MREHPIPFNGDMVRAILDGRKTQTRRLVKVQPVESTVSIEIAADRTYYEISRGGSKCHILSSKCPYAVGDRLWVRETWQSVAAMNICHKADDYIVYRATDPDWSTMDGWRWRPSIHMPRWASRITLEITEVRVQRLQDISEQDCDAEGIYNESGLHLSRCRYMIYHADHDCGCGDKSPQEEYAAIWDSIYGKRHPWQSNPWVWVYTFRRIEP